MPIKLATILLSLSLICACTTNSIKENPTTTKPFSSLFGHSSACKIGDECDYTGYFDKYSPIDPNIIDVLYTYNDDGQCILIIANESDLKSFNNELNKAQSLSSGELSIKGEAIARHKLDYWSKSSFCNDSNWVLNLKSIDAVLVIYH